MKPRAIIDRAQLARALSAISGAIERRMSIPILSHVLIGAADGQLRIQGTNTDVYAQTLAPAGVSSPWEATCPHEPLLRLAMALPEGSQVELTPDDGRIAVRAGRTSVKLSSLPVAHFPSAPELTDGATLEIPAAQLARLLSAPAPFIDTASNAKAPRGIWLHSPPAGGLWSIGASSSGLVALRGEGEIERGAVIPQETAGIFSAVLKGIDGSVRLEISETLCRLTAPDITITSKLVGDAYPEYWRIVPTDLPVSLTFDATQLRDALKRVLSLSDTSSDHHKSRALTFDVKDGAVTLSTSNRDSGIDTQEEIDGDAEPTLMRFTVNGGRVLQLLSTLDAETVVMRGNEQRSTFLLEPVGKPADGIRMTAAMRV